MNNSIALLIFALIPFLFMNCSYKKNENAVSNENILKETIDTQSDTIIISRYSNGNIRSSSRFSEGKRFGTTNTFYSNGNLKNSFFFNHKGELIYKADYVEDGSYLKSEGNPIYVNFNPKRDSLKVEKEFELIIMAPKLPFGDTNIILGVEEGSEVKEVHRQKMENYGLLLQYSLSKEGKQNIPVIIEIEHDANTIQIDTSFIEVFVSG